VTSDPYQAYPSFPTGAPYQFVEEPAVELVAAGPVKQRRLTVAFRLILAIPHMFVLFFLGVAGFVVVFLGWWGALFMGRLPGFAVSYLSGLARWNARVYGYSFLLTDDYPPFTFDDDLAYPIVIDIPTPGRLNRFAVFFRLILAVWAHIVLSVVTSAGNVIVLFIAWLIMLVTGKLPAPLHLAFTAVLRFQTRYYCYMGMLTSTYPWKLFGDQPGASAPVAPAQAPGWAAPAEPTAPAESAWGTPPADWAPPAYGATPAYGSDTGTGTGPGYEPTVGYGTPGGYGTPTGYGTPGGYGTPPGSAGYGNAQPVAPPASWRLVLPQSAKVLLIVLIVLGVITNVGEQVGRIALANRTTNTVNSQAAITQWNSADTALNAEMKKWATKAKACDSGSQGLACATAADAQAAGYMSAFASQVQAIAMPSGAASAAAAKTVTDATRTSGDFTTISQDTTVAQYQADMASSGLSPDLDAVQTDINNVAAALGNSELS
jgi:uncharacterized protein DUF4389